MTNELIRAVYVFNYCLLRQFVKVFIRRYVETGSLIKTQTLNFWYVNEKAALKKARTVFKCLHYISVYVYGNNRWITCI